MKDTYVVGIDKLKGYQNALNGEHTSFTNGSRKTFSSGYLFSCSDSSIISMRDKINSYYSNIDKGYNNINKWLDSYIKENTNLENSLTNGSVIGISENGLNMLLNSFVGKKKVNIKLSTDITKKKNETVTKNSSITPTTTSATVPGENSSLEDIFEYAIQKVSKKMDSVIIETYGIYSDDYI